MRKTNKIVLLSAVVIFTLVLWISMAIRWSKADIPKVVLLEDKKELSPLSDKVKEPEFGFRYYEKDTYQLTISRGTFPLLNKQKKFLQTSYFSEKD